MKKILLLFMSVFAMNIVLTAQCVNSSQYPSTAVAITDGTLDTISTCNYLEEYSIVTGVVAGETYEFTVTSSGYITVYQDGVSTTLLGNGTSPLSVTSVTGGDMWVHWNVDATCTTATNCVITTVQWTSWTPPTCPPPTAQIVTNLTSTTATLDWTTGGATNWDIEWGMAGFTQGSGTMISNTTTNPYSLSGLNPATAYEFYVRDLCGADTSTWTGPFAFSTLCTNYAAPFCETFDGGTVDCWGDETVTDQFDWSLGTGTTPSSNTGPDAAHGGAQYIYTETSGPSNGDTAILYSPSIDLTALTTPAIDFYYHMYGAGMDADGTFAIDVSNDGGTTWTSIFSEMGNHGNQWNNGYVEMAAFAGDTVIFRFLGIVSTTGTTYENDFALDDFCVIEALPCPGAPSDLLATITGVDALLTWTNNFSATDWIVEWDTAGFVQGTGNIVATTDTFTNLTSLPINQDYEFYVRDYCGSTDSSNWSGPFTFHIGYCIPGGGSFQDPMGITNVTMGTINNTTGLEAGSYGDYTAMITDAGQGGALNIDVTLETGYTYDVWAWVDWNDNLVFDSIEAFYLGESTNSIPTTLSSSIDIPASASLGNHRIRIGGSDSGLGTTYPSFPCYTGNYTVFEDYTLNVVTCPTGVTSIDTAFCIGGTLTLSDGSIVDTAGSVTDTLTTVIGCDSALVYNITILMPTSSNISETICSGDSYTFGTQILTTAGTYIDTIPNANGCDSIMTLNLTVNMPTSSSMSETICSGDTYQFGTQTLTTAGTYTDTTSNANGCDSVITLNLTVNMPTSSSMSETICSGDTYQFGTQTLTTAGTYTDTTSNANGCDSIVTLTLTVNNTTTSEQTVLLCEQDNNQYILPDGTVVTEAGTYTATVTGSNGCDETITYDVSDCVGIFDIDNNVGITLFPNPAKNVLNVVFSEKLSNTNNITVVDLLGKAIYTIDNVEGVNLTINTSKIANGLYYLNVTSDNKTSVKSFTISK